MSLRHFIPVFKFVRIHAIFRSIDQLRERDYAREQAQQDHMWPPKDQIRRRLGNDGLQQ